MTPEMNADVLLPFLAAIVGGALRVGVPFLFVSLGECLTEKAGRINLGLEGVLVLSAMAGFGGSYLTGSPWLGVLAAVSAGALLGLLHGLLCSLPRVNDVATGIALMLLGTGLAFYLGKPLIQPQATQLPPIALGVWSDSSVLQAALQINPLLPLGVALAFFMQWGFARTRWGLLVRLAGDSAPATKALGYSTSGIRIAATAAGGAIAGLGGASLSLFYPGSWNEGISSGQGLIAVALVIFARWSPLRCLGAALLFGGAGAIGPALQSIGISKGKARKPYEFGVKVSLVVTHLRGLMVGARSFTGNPYDGHTLAAQLEQTRNLMQDLGRTPKQVVVDLGYRGVDADNPGIEIIHRGKYKSLSAVQRKWLKRRQAIEPLIGHTKADHGMQRCWLKGEIGDALHALSCAAGYNIRWLLRAIAGKATKDAKAFLWALLGTAVRARLAANRAFQAFAGAVGLLGEAARRWIGSRLAHITPLGSLQVT